MNRLRFPRQIAHGILATLLLAACTGNELTDGNPQGTPLPEGRYPLTFTATQSTATPQTRVVETADGTGSTWTDGDQISVNIGSETQIGTYTLNADGSIKETVTPLYWQNTAEATVNGWYPTDETVDLSNQSARLKYVLKGTGRGSYQSAPALTFTHQLAKVRVKLEGTAKDLVNTTIGVLGYPSCTHTKGVVTATGPKTYLTMHRVTYNRVVYYEANVVPGTLEAANAFRITVDNKSADIALTSNVDLAAGKWHEITLTVNKALTPVEPITISGNGEYTIFGSGDKTITITSGSPKITLQSVTSTAVTAIEIKDGASPTILLKGINTFNAPDGKASVIWLNGTNANVTIDGNNTGSLVIKKSGNGPQVDGAIIGSEVDLVAGNITVQNATLNIDVAQARAVNAAIIGSGLNSSCGNINIINTDLTIKGGAKNIMGAFIGTGLGESSRNASCGQIVIQLQNTTTKESFLNKLSPFDPPTHLTTQPGQVGTGGTINEGTTSVGGVTWKDFDGNTIS